MTETLLHGRDAELAVADRCLDEAVQGRGGVLLVTGWPGMGKSSLLAEIGRRAQLAGARLLRAEAVDGTQSVPFAPLLSAALNAEPAILEAAAVRELGERDDMRFWVIHDLRSALEITALYSPVVVLLDDLHWADSATLDAVRVLSAQLRHVGVLWVLSSGENGSGARSGDGFARLERDGAVTVRLGPLPSEAIRSIVADVVGAAPEPALMELAEKAHGHAFWLIELLRGLRDEQRLVISSGRATVTDDRLPVRVRWSMAERLTSLAPLTRRTVQLAAMLPQRFTVSQLAELLHCRPGGLVEPLEDALTAGLLAGERQELHCRPGDLVEPLEDALAAGLLAGERQELHFRHELLREAARDTIPATLQPVLEREAVDALMRTGATPCAVAATLARTAQPGDTVSAATLRTAAHTIVASDPSAAADLSIRALELLPADSRDRGSLVTDAVVQLHRAARFEEARELGDRELAAHLSPQEEAEARLLLSAMPTGSKQDRVAENRRALALVGVAEGTRVQHRARLAYNLMMSGAPDEAERLALDLETDLETGPDPGTDARALALVVLANTRCARGDGSGTVSRVQQLRLLLPEATEAQAAKHHLHIANTMICLGRTTEGMAAFDGALSFAERDRNTSLLDDCNLVSAMFHLAAGRLTQAQSAAEARIDLVDRDASGNYSNALRMATAACIAAHTGDVGLTVSAIAAARLHQHSEDPVGRRWAVRVLARSLAANATTERVAGLLVGDPLLPTSPPLPTDIQFLAWTARLAVVAGAQDLRRRALEAAALLEGRPEIAPAFAAAGHHIRGLIGQDVGQLEAATVHYLAAGRPLLAATADEDAGTVLLRRESTGDGVRLLDRAISAYTECGAAVDVDRARRVKRRFGVADWRPDPPGSDRGWASLTESELRVVRLIATGATNRVAAKELFLSPHTVNSHVRHAFTKLGINSRVQLTNLMRDFDRGAGSGRRSPDRHADYSPSV